jgi:hypothetical protein
MRDFRLYERLRMQFRGEAYSATNHPQWGIRHQSEQPEYLRGDKAPAAPPHRTCYALLLLGTTHASHPGFPTTFAPRTDNRHKSWRFLTAASICTIRRTRCRHTAPLAAGGLIETDVVIRPTESS